MTLDEIIYIVKGETKLYSNKKVKNICIDTRKIKKGDIFIAIKGKKYDGHNYIKEAIKKGAIACIGEMEIDDDEYIKVNSTYETLFLLGNYFRKIYNIPLIAITGSTGKTTTKELLVHILKSKYKILYNKENKNNIIGVSNTLFNLNKKYNLIVMELGSNHMGEISCLSKMCNPNISIITNIGSSHLGYFKTKKNIFKEKTSIIDGMFDKNLIINGDDKYLKKLDYYKCGLDMNNDLIAYNIFEYENYITFNINIDKEYTIVFNNPCKHFINDILLAIKVCLDYEMKIEEIIKKIKTFKLINKRMNIIKNKSNIIIDDCYNSSYESVVAGLNYVKKISKHKIIIIGDILELGKYSHKIHKKINKLLIKLKDTDIYTVGKYSKKIKGINFNNSTELLKYLKNIKIKESYIYIKGSRGMGLDIIADFLKKNKSYL